MDFELDDTQTLVRDTAREFARKTLRPQAATFEREQVIPEEVFRQMGELGLLAIHLPEELGGSGTDVVSYSAAMIEIAQGCASTAVTMAVTNMVGEVIAEFGDQGQKDAFCPRIASGEILGGFALSEVDAGSDPGGMRTTAVRDGDDWILNGTKQWISHGDTAGVLVVWARTSDLPGAKGVSCFLVEGGTPGLAVAGHEDKMGLRASHTCSLVFEDCRVPGTALLGSLDGGFRIAMMALDGGRIGIASQAIGIAEGALGDAIAYAKDRKAFERSIADFQAVRWMIADSRMELDAARLLTWRAARLKSDAQPFTQEASMAKLYASEAAWAVCNRALQVHGGYGYMREYAVERALRDVRVTQIYEGTSEVQRLVIARNALRA